jgi:hypothetical protein
VSKGGRNQKRLQEAMAQLRAENAKLKNAPAAAAAAPAAPIRRFRRRYLQDWFAGALVVFTLAQVFVGFWQWEATNDQYKSMIEQSKIANDQLKQSARALEQTDKAISLTQIDQRAWLSLSDGFQIVSGDLNQRNDEIPLVIEFLIRNSGKTPAHITEKRINLYSLKDPNAIDAVMKAGGGPVNDRDHPGSIVNVPPDTAMKFRVEDEHFLYAADDGAKGKQGEFFMAGRIFYTDVFGHRRWTECCYKYDPKHKKFLGYHKHNTMH